jgi:hypothetical protein
MSTSDARRALPDRRTAYQQEPGFTTTIDVGTARLAAIAGLGGVDLIALAAVNAAHALTAQHPDASLNLVVDTATNPDGTITLTAHPGHTGPAEGFTRYTLADLTARTHATL